MEPANFSDFVLKHRIAGTAKESKKFTKNYQRLREFWDGKMSDYCSFLISLFEISMDHKYRFKFCNADESRGYTSSEMANFMGMLTKMV